MGASEKRYSVYLQLEQKALKVIRKKAYDRTLSISELLRKYLEETGFIPKED